MFNSILIANRGEIACRIIRTARRLGARTIAVFSEADRYSRHVEMADEAVCIGASSPAESYLNGRAIISAAIDAGACAIHPGYGFLSENPEFVELAEASNLVFIGPSADAIRAMGLKDSAKARMVEAGVPVVPGYHGPNQDDGFLAEQAEKTGYPVMIKAVAGGGGKGMRLVESPANFQEALESARGEAETAFANRAVLIEKFIRSPRHIEVQVFGDGVNAIHLFERDCSLQRRHQKVIEEAPAPGMTNEMRMAMGAAAVRAAESIGYKGAGTVEFIADGGNGLSADGFWFMEMNTRLQVEHPVTEAVTGIDLVEWQLRVASGENLPKRQSELGISGHAFEARLYAEDASKGFLPVTGSLTHLAFPDTVRIDSGVRAGDHISPYYDPMIAKIISHGETRSVALKRLADALLRTEVAGTVTNLAFLGELARHGDFNKGKVDTGLIARDMKMLVLKSEPDPSATAIAGIAAMGLLEMSEWDIGFNIWSSLQKRIVLHHEGRPYEVFIKSISARAHDVLAMGVTQEIRHNSGRWLVNGAPMPRFSVANGMVTVFSRYGISFEVDDPLARDAKKGSSADLIEAPMPGLVKVMLARPGHTVHEGERLAVLEAMKMEHSLLAERDGVVAEVLADEGSQVEAGAALVRLEGGK
ncbi:MAG: ATP-grasp domain-containing protein [Roseovarius sp.]|nr:ATP-grasp domain-containing protein [Roseovarius sp.]